MTSSLLRGVVLVAAIGVALSPALAQSKSQRAKPRPQPAFTWGGFPAPHANATPQQRQTAIGLQQITCPPPARPTCGSSR